MLKFLKSIFPGRQNGGPAPRRALPAEEVLVSLRRSCWTPVAEGKDCAPEDSKFSGVVAVPAGESWPRCPNCNQPMQLFLQLSPAGLPEEVEWPWLNGLLQLFYCTSSNPFCEVDCQAYFPFSRSTLVRIVDLLSPRSVASPPASVFPPRRIVGWKRLDDFPDSQEFESASLSEEESEAIAEAGYPLPGDKLLGWPAWIQGLEYPSCPQCNQPMEYLFQIDSEDNVPHAFGDAGCGHVTFCRKHPNVLAFGWACT